MKIICSVEKMLHQVSIQNQGFRQYQIRFLSTSKCIIRYTERQIESVSFSKFLKRI